MLVGNDDQSADCVTVLKRSLIEDLRISCSIHADKWFGDDILFLLFHARFPTHGDRIEVGARQDLEFLVEVARHRARRSVFGAFAEHLFIFVGGIVECDWKQKKEAGEMQSIALHLHFDGSM